MKNLTVITILLISLFSCTKDKEHNPKQYSQKWQLIKMTGQVPNSETTGTRMEWQESYLLNLDNTFTKSRERNSVKTEASGTFSYRVSSDETFLVLTYTTNNDIIGNCTSELKEELLVKSNKLVGTWAYCDGPGLEYERIN